MTLKGKSSTLLHSKISDKVDTPWTDFLIVQTIIFLFVVELVYRLAHKQLYSFIL